MTYRTFAVFGLSAFLAVTAAVAQDRLEAKVPFNFRVGQSVMPSGNYMISQTGPIGTIVIKSADQSSSAIVITNAVQSDRNASTGKLVFRRYGDTYFLSQVWKPGTDRGHQLIQTRTEREMASARPSGIEVASVPLNRQ